MPKVSAAHEHSVRARIVDAAVHVFAEKGYHAATMQDVVRRSGLSVGAIYTYFRSKDDLFLAGCDLSNGIALGELADRLVRGRTVVDKLAIAIGFFLDAVDDPNGAPGMASVLVSQWSRAEQEPQVRAMLNRRREQLMGAGQLLIREGIATGELPGWIDAEAVTAGYLLLMDGLLLWRIEQGDAYRREEADRRALAVLAPLVAAAASESPAPITPAAERPWSVLDGPGSGREEDARIA
jgi:AcrR family transcriptional regulator